MTRWLLLPLALLCLPGLGRAAEKPHHPNIVFVLIDDLGYADRSTASTFCRR